MANLKPIVVMTSSPIMAHFKSLLPISSYLVKQGHEVHITTGEVLRADSEWTGATFHPYPNEISDPQVLIKEAEGIEKGTPQRVNLDLIQFFLGPIPLQYETLQNVVEDITSADTYQGQPIVIMYECVSYAIAPFLLGAPWRGVRPSACIAIGSVPLMISDPDLGPFNLGLPPDSTPEGRAKYSAITEQVFGKDGPMGGAQIFWEETVKGLGATKPPGPMFNAPRLADRYLHCSLEEQEYPRSDAPRTLHYIGWPELKGRKVPPLPPFWDEILEVSRTKSKPIVFACQGTVPWNDMNDLIVPTIKGLANEDILLIVSLGAPHQKLPEDLEIPANTRVCNYIPFEDLFPHLDLFVNSGGFGSTQQALYYGVPLILVGTGEDKPENNARIEWTGTAINLKCQTAKPDDVREAVLKMLGDESYINKARHFRDEYHKLNPLELVENHMQAALRERN